MCEIEEFIGCKIKRDLTKVTLKIYQPGLINKITQWSNEGVRSLMIFDTPATPHKVHCT